MVQAFDDAYNHFYESLPPAEQKRYVAGVSPEALLEAINQLQKHAKQRQKQRISQSLSKIGTVVKSLEQYFKAVDVIIQSHPEYAALVWGAMRFVLQVCRRSLEKISHGNEDLQVLACK